ncbi:transcriptional regulator [Pandoraea captiosa]|uniref:Transcriptional regulator n=1 Tax=Pandoraea captiosa TaxID=2508302 RepID=A0A5E4ZT88_9BURK|nr:helix-turn-helix transcriptional regulator [Pandoraea captiosa]VVE64286.1 transcriptional regulator [Pandoraea captiosa]
MQTNPLALFGDHLARLRKARGWSQEKLALESGLARSYVSGIERGRRNVALVNICVLADTLGVPTSEMLRFAQNASSAADGADAATPGERTPLPQISRSLCKLENRDQVWLAEIIRSLSSRLSHAAPPAATAAYAQTRADALDGDVVVDQIQGEGQHERRDEGRDEGRDGGRDEANDEGLDGIEDHEGKAASVAGDGEGSSGEFIALRADAADGADNAARTREHHARFGETPPRLPVDTGVEPAYAAGHRLAASRSGDADADAAARNASTGASPMVRPIGEPDRESGPSGGAAREPSRPLIDGDD